MKLKQILTASLLCFSAGLYAASTHLTVELLAGEKYEFLLADKPVVTFAGMELVVNGSETTSYTIAGVKNFHFSEHPTDADQHLNAIQIVALDGDQLEIRNVNAGLTVALYAANGVLWAESKAGEDGAVRFTLPQQNGIYVLKSGNTSIKVIKK
ncbi:MAG: hypothetical protein KBT32_01895 [Bacteroidales bacterium]|nr:hypothetical protein [Candidatus Physcocola equi]